MSKTLNTCKMRTLRKSQADPFRQYLLPMVFVFLSLILSFSLDAQFKEESARAAYELRMNGEVLYAHAMLQNLINLEKTEGGLVHYEMARTKKHQQLGGAKMNPDAIINSTKKAVKEDPGSILFAVADAGARFDKAYVSLMMEGKTAGEDINRAVESLEKVLEMNPDFHEVRVRLVEIYSKLPEDLAGDKDLAEMHASYLEEQDWYFGILARDAMLPDSASRVGFWKMIMKNHNNDTRAAIKLGKAYLLEGNMEEAKPILESAMKEDPRYNILLLHIGRYHMYQVMWDKGKAKKELPLAEAAFQKFLELEPETVAPLKAWVTGKMAMFNKIRGNEEGFDRLMEEAMALDPSFSKASGLPVFDLFVPPGEIYRSGDYATFLRPF